MWQPFSLKRLHCSVRAAPITLILVYMNQKGPELEHIVSFAAPASIRRPLRVKPDCTPPLSVCCAAPPRHGDSACWQPAGC